MVDVGIGESIGGKSNPYGFVSTHKAALPSPQVTPIENGSAPLIGRDAELRRLTALLGQAGGPGVALVSGPAGIGKSTLLRALVGVAEARDIRVGWGVAGEFEGASPLWPWFEAISAVDATQTVVASGSEVNLEARDKVEVFRSVAQWLTAAGARAPLLLVLEDMHDANPTALDLLSYLARRPASPNVLIVVSSRPGCSAVETLRCPQILLSGFTTDEVAQLAGQMGSPIDRVSAADVTRRTEGNPLFVQRLIEQGSVDTGGPLPGDVEALLRQQLDDLPEAVAPLLDALAVFGSTSENLLTQAADVAGDTGSLLASASSVVSTTNGIVVFRHALLRELVYDDLAPQRRFDLHARAAEVLRTDGAGPIVLAHHLGRAAATNRGREAAEAAWQTAIIERSMGALSEAADHFLLAASIFADLDDRTILAEVMVDHGEVLAQLGRIGAAEDRLLEVVDLDVAGDARLGTDIRRRLIREYGRLRWREEPNMSSLRAERLEAVARAWLDPQASDHDAAALNIALVMAAEIRGLTPGDLAHADAALAAATKAGDQRLLAEAHLSRRRALMVHPMAVVDRRKSAEAAVRAIKGVDDPELLSRARRMAQCDALAMGDRQRSLGLVNVEAVSAAEREQLGLALAGTASIEGRYEDAEEVLDEAIKDLAYLGLETPSLEFVRLTFSWDRGELVDALRELEPLLPVIADPGLRAATALAKVLDDQIDVAATLIEETYTSLTTGPPSLLWCMAMTMAGEAAAGIGHFRCADILTELEPLSGQCAVPAAAPLAWVGAIDRILGLLCLRLGRHAEAVDYLERSLVLHERMGAEPWEARSHAGLGVALRAVGRADDAEEHSLRAEEIRARLGMGRGILLIGDFETQLTEAPQPTTDPDSREATLRRDGDVWRVGLGDRISSLRHTSGLDYLALLIAKPEVDWHVLDLYATVAGAPVILEGDGGAMLDDRARREYQQRYQDLSASLAEAEDHADVGQAETIRDEIEALERGLLSAFGLGGRERSMDDPSEKARINVRRAISRALDRIAENSPTLAEHLRRSVHTGRFCRYSPDPSAVMTWS